MLAGIVDKYTTVCLSLGKARARIIQKLLGSWSWNQCPQVKKWRLFSETGGTSPDT